MTNLDDEFFDRADEHISLSNKQLLRSPKGEVSASMMYSVARFNAWISATEYTDSQTMHEVKEETIKYFLKEYEKRITCISFVGVHWQKKFKEKV